MASTTTPNMSLTLPTIGQELAPTWASDLNSSLATIDNHNHSSGSGVAITPAGLSISSDLSFLTNNAIALRSLRFTPQVSALSGATDLGCLFEVGVDLYYRDGSGNAIRLTQSGSIAGTSGSIGGLTSPASATYVAATPAFVFQSAANTPANIDGGAITLRNILANSKGITISPPAALAANYSLTLPAALPSVQSFLTVDNSGNVAASWSPDNITLDVASNLLEIKPGGVSTSQIGNSAVTTAKIASGAVTLAQLAGQSIASSFQSANVTATTTTLTFANLATTLTTTGRYVNIHITSDGGFGTGVSYLELQNTQIGPANFTEYGEIVLQRNGTTIALWDFGGYVGITPSNFLRFPINFNFIDPSAPAGSNSYAVYIRLTTAPTGSQLLMTGGKIFAYEMGL